MCCLTFRGMALYRSLIIAFSLKFHRPDPYCNNIMKYKNTFTLPVFWMVYVYFLPPCFSININNITNKFSATRSTPIQPQANQHRIIITFTLIYYNILSHLKSNRRSCVYCCKRKLFYAQLFHKRVHFLIVVTAFVYKFSFWY